MSRGRPWAQAGCHSWNGGCPVGSLPGCRARGCPSPSQEAVRAQQSGAVQGYPRAVSEQLCDCAGPAAARCRCACMRAHCVCAWLGAGTAGCCLAAPSSQPSRGRACEPRQAGRARQRGLGASRAPVPEQGPCPCWAGCRARWELVGRSSSEAHTALSLLSADSSSSTQIHHRLPRHPLNRVPGAGVGIRCRNHCPTCLLTPGHRFWCCPNTGEVSPLPAVGREGGTGACCCLQQGVGHAQACARAEQGRVLRVPPALPRWQLRGQDRR